MMIQVQLSSNKEQKQLLFIQNSSVSQGVFPHLVAVYVKGEIL